MKMTGTDGSNIVILNKVDTELTHKVTDNAAVVSKTEARVT